MRFLSSVLAVTYLLATSGCSRFVQIAPTDYAARESRKNVLVRTQSGEQFAFDRVAVTPDSLRGFGYQQRSVLLANGDLSTEEVAREVRLPLTEVASFQEKRRDWNRTTKWGLGLLGAAAFVVAVGTHKDDTPPTPPPGGKEPF